MVFCVETGQPPEPARTGAIKIFTLDVHRQTYYIADHDSELSGQTDKAIFRWGVCPRVQGFDRQAWKRLDILGAATSIADLKNLPSNRLEALHGDRAGQFSIRVNQQWRICFTWPAGEFGPSNVEIVDYH